MADERIDIEVTDKVAKSIKTELAAIAAAAREGHGSIGALKREMASLSVAANQSSRTIASQAKAQAAMAVADSRAAEAKARVALAEQRVATEAAKTAAASAKAEKASQQRERQARATATAIDREAAAQARLSSIPITGGGAVPQANRGNQPFGQYGAGTKSGARNQTFAMDPANDPTPQIKKAGDEAEKTSVKIGKMGESGKLATHHMTNLGFQLNDIFVSLASGQKPLTVFIQQGAQIGQIGAQAGVGMMGLAKAALAVVAPFLPLVAVLGTAAAGIALLTHEANNDSGLKKYTTAMGYTKAEVKKLNAVTVTFGDTMKAVFQVGMERIMSAFGSSIDGIGNKWRSLMEYLGVSTKDTLAAVYASVMTASKLANPVGGAVLLVKGRGNLIEGARKDYEENNKQAKSFLDDVVKQSRKNALETQNAMAKDFYDAPKKKKGPKGWDRAQELKNENAALDEQIRLSSLYGDELERANQLEQISKKFRDHNVPLTVAETEALNGKITALQKGRQFQEAQNQLYDETVKAGERIVAQIGAVNEANKKGTITDEEAARRKNILNESFKNFQEPLAAYNRDLQQSRENMGLYGDALSDAVRSQELFNQAIANGTANRVDNSAKDFVGQAKSERETSTMTGAFADIDPYTRQDTTSYILKNYEAMYASIAALRDGDVAHETEANKRKQNLDRALGDAKLSIAAETFGNLASLTESKNKELAAIGKAAAIAEATINGFVAVTRTMREFPGPLGIALGVSQGIAAAVQVAKIAGVGFEQGGYTGNVGTKSVAGVVHGQEYVMDAKTTARIGVPTLDAIRSGRLTQAPVNNNGRTPNVNVKQYPGVEIETREMSDGDIELIARRVLRNEGPTVIAQDMRASPSSRTSRAMQQSFNVKRNR